MNINYEHSQNLHTIAGPQRALPQIFSKMPESMLDVGCGIGTWLRAARDAGIADIYGIDGVDIRPDKLLFEPSCFKQCDLSKEIDLGRKFDVVLCLEVAEHLEENSASVLIKTLTMHADRIIFSAACPGQTGQHHVNCQWPIYWQNLFNSQGFACEDSLRWRIWNLEEIEPWYRQNTFLAFRDTLRAGSEPRIPSVIHPAILPGLNHINEARKITIAQIEQGGLAVPWYFAASASALFAKMKRFFKKYGAGIV